LNKSNSLGYHSSYFGNWNKYQLQCKPLLVHLRLVLLQDGSLLGVEIALLVLALSNLGLTLFSTLQQAVSRLL